MGKSERSVSGGRRVSSRGLHDRYGLVLAATLLSLIIIAAVSERAAGRVLAPLLFAAILILDLVVSKASRRAIWVTVALIPIPIAVSAVAGVSEPASAASLVGTLLSIGGFEVIDVGSENEPWDFYEKAEEVGADMIAVSLMFVPAMQKFTELMDLLQQTNVREKYKVIVGGAVTTQEWAESTGVDGWGSQAKDGVELAKKLLET